MLFSAPACISRRLSRYNRSVGFTIMYRERTSLTRLSGSWLATRTITTAGATHIFDTFTDAYEFPDPDANRRKCGVIHVRPDPEARELARDAMTRFFSAVLKSQ